jgi:hypothetical protein
MVVWIAHCLLVTAVLCCALAGGDPPACAPGRGPRHCQEPMALLPLATPVQQQQQATPGFPALSAAAAAATAALPGARHALAADHPPSLA